jgi:hypothetical protein
MELSINRIKVGDYVKVKKGVKDPDFESQFLEGWQGEITDIQKEEALVEIKGI